MDFLAFKQKILEKQKVLYSGFPERMFDLMCYRKVLDGTLYDVLSYAFFQKVTGGSAGYSQNIPMSKRRPSVRSRLIKIVVDDSVSLLFGEGRFPSIKIEDKDMQNDINSIIKDSFLNLTMMEAAYKGSIGSSAIFVKLINNKLYFEVLSTEFLMPKFDKFNPDILEKITELKKFSGKTLMMMGYTDLDPHCDYWLEREWDAKSETYYKPYKVNADKPKKEKDKDNSIDHNFGVVPIIWIKNLVGGQDPDGLCTFDGAIDTNIELDYQLSQAGRGLRYSNEPLLKIAGQSLTQDGLDLTQSNILMLDEGGDAGLIEIKGGAVEACLEYTKRLREIILENIHGNRTNPDKINAAQSGRALELLHQPLIGLADKLRITYGEKGMIQLFDLIVTINQTNEIVVDKTVLKAGQLNPKEKINIIWSDWFPATRSDRLADANTLKTLRDAALISSKTAVLSLADEYDFDAEDELVLIEEDQKKRMEELKMQTTQTIQA